MADALEVVRQPVDGLGDLPLDVAEAVGGRGLRAAPRANSALAAWTVAGSASRSRAVMAMVLAAATMPARAMGLTAASANSRVWMGSPLGAGGAEGGGGGGRRPA